MTDLVDILYVDDEPFNSNRSSEKMCKLFEKNFANCRARFARTNKEAFNKLNLGHYDAILYDIGMDVTESYVIADSIKNLKPGALLIAMTGAMTSLDMLKLKLPDCFDGRIYSPDLAIYYKTILPYILKEKGIVLKLREENFIKEKL